MPKKKYSREQRIARFWSRVNITGLLDCWLWKGTCMPFGYGLTKGLDGRTTVAHRISWEITKGAIPQGMFVLHICDIPQCVSPNHLYIGTQKDNIRDAIERGRFHYIDPPHGTDCKHSKLTEAQVLEIRELAKTGQMKQTDIGERYGISGPMVSFIKLRKRWKHLA